MRILLYVLIGYIIFLLFRRKALPPGNGAGKETEAETFQDPICGVYVSEEEAVVGRLENRRVHFCSMACLEKFRDQLEHKTEKGRTEE